MQITQAQIKLIHTLKSVAGINNDEYSAMLGSFGVTTSKALTQKQADVLISALNKFGKKTKPKYTKVRVSAKGEYYATKAQLAKIKAVWYNSPAVLCKNDESLQAYITRITGIQSKDWLLMKHVRKIIKAIESLDNESN